MEFCSSVSERFPKPRVARSIRVGGTSFSSIVSMKAVGGTANLPTIR